MSETTKQFLLSVLTWLYAIFLITGTTYLVGWRGWSKWTYLFMAILFGCLEVKGSKIKQSFFKIKFVNEEEK